MHRECKCFHHKFVLILGALGGVAAIIFFWAALSGGMVWGLDDTFYFESVIVLAVAAHGTKMCSCCRGHGTGYQCEDCGVGEMSKPQM